MSTITPTFQGEVQFRRYSDTSTQGQQLVFAVHGRDDLERFIGKEGRRFMAVLVEIGDDEMPIPPKSTELKPRAQLGDLCYRAVMWCNDAEFQKWLGMHHGKTVRTAEQASEFIREFCGVTSRKHLDTNLAAKSTFIQHFLGPWQKYQIARRSS